MLPLLVAQVPDNAPNNELTKPAEFGSLANSFGQQQKTRVAEQSATAQGAAGVVDVTCLSDRVRQEIRRRKSRANLLGISPDIFSMPAWEILLELLLAELTGQKNQVTTVGLDTGIPQSTVQRWLAVLENLALVQRRRDRADKRRHWIGLTAKARQGLLQYFEG